MMNKWSLSCKREINKVQWNVHTVLLRVNVKETHAHVHPRMKEQLPTELGDCTWEEELGSGREENSE